MLPAKTGRSSELAASFAASCEGESPRSYCPRIAASAERDGYLMLDLAVPTRQRVAPDVARLKGALSTLSERAPRTPTPAVEAFTEHQGAFALYMPASSPRVLGTMLGLGATASALGTSTPENRPRFYANGLKQTILLALMEDPQVREYDDHAVLFSGGAKGLRIDAVQSTTTLGQSIHEAAAAPGVSISQPSMPDALFELDMIASVGPALDASRTPSLMRKATPERMYNTYEKHLRDAGMFGWLSALAHPHATMNMVRVAFREPGSSGLPFRDPLAAVLGISLRVKQTPSGSGFFPFIVAATVAIKKDALTKADLDKLGFPLELVEKQTHDEVRVALGADSGEFYPVKLGEYATQGTRVLVRPNRVDRKSPQWTGLMPMLEDDPFLKLLASQERWQLVQSDAPDRRTVRVTLGAPQGLPQTLLALTDRTPAQSADKAWAACTMAPAESIMDLFEEVTTAPTEERATKLASGATSLQTTLDACAKGMFLMSAYG